MSLPCSYTRASLVTLDLYLRLLCNTEAGADALLTSESDFRDRMLCYCGYSKLAPYSAMLLSAIYSRHLLRRHSCGQGQDCGGNSGC